MVSVGRHTQPMSLIDNYLARTPGSRALFERATASIPGGSTRTTIFNPPYPPYMARGEGLRTWDVDGNEYRDFLGNYTSLILGHAHPAVVAAVEAQVRLGSAFAAPTEIEIELAEEIRGRLPSVERIRFTNSGTEATMFAIRAARAFTGRPLLAKFAKAYHGTHDTALAGTPGVPDGISDLVIELPWDDADGVEAALAGRERDVAAIIIEPVQGAGGIRAADPAFLRFLRDYADRIGAVLIFDEIIAFRIGPNGAQGVVRRPAGPDDARQDHRRRLSARGVRRPGRDHGSLRRPAARRAEPRRDVQRQSGRRRGRPRDPALPDDRPIRAPGEPRRATAGPAGRRVRGARSRRPGRRRSHRSSRSSRGRRSTARATCPRPRRSSSASSSTASISRPAGWARSRRPATEADIDALADAVVGRIAAMQPAAASVR